MQVTDELIRTVVQEVLSHMGNGKSAPSNGRARARGVFADVNSAVAAASAAQREFAQRKYLALRCLVGREVREVDGAFSHPGKSPIERNSTVRGAST